VGERLAAPRRRASSGAERDPEVTVFDGFQIDPVSTTVSGFLTPLSGPITTRLAYNFRSKFKSGDDRGTPMWQDDYGTLDGTFNYAVNSHLTLTVDAQNLLDHKLRYFVGSPSIPRAYYDYGQTFYAGFRLKY